MSVGGIVWLTTAEWGFQYYFLGGKCDRSWFIDFLGVVGCASSGGGDTFKRMTSARVAPAPKTLEWTFQ